MVRAEKNPQLDRVLVMGSVGLNRSTDAPQTPSTEGQQLVQQQPEVKEAYEATIALRPDLLAKHGSLNAAEDKVDQLWNEYKDARDALDCVSLVSR